MHVLFGVVVQTYQTHNGHILLHLSGRVCLRMLVNSNRPFNDNTDGIDKFHKKK